MNAPTNRPAKHKLLVLGAVLTACALGIGGYAWHVVRRVDAASASPPSFARLAALPAAGAAAKPFILYRNTALGPDYGKVAMAYPDDADAPRAAAALECDRVYFARGGGASAGICLQSRRSAVTTYHALIFDERFEVRKAFDLAGFPSRTRISPDGRRAAFTVFISGQAYSNPGFSTRTSIVDTVSGEMEVEDLETWGLTRDGVTFKAQDFNFWGVTFSRDGRRFFATLGTAGHTYLVEGDFSTRAMKVVHDEVECPSLSPDESRIAFKHREPPDAQGRSRWSLAVLDLATSKITPLTREVRNVDDQVEWIDSKTVAYGLPREGNQSSAATDIWTMAADGTTAPRQLLSFAQSPAAVR